MIIFFCTLAFIAAPLLAIYDRLYPWPPAISALTNEGNPNSRICVGIGSEDVTTYNNKVGWSRVAKNQRSYLLLSSLINHPATISVSVDQDGTVSIDRSTEAIFVLIVWYFVCAYLATRFVIKPLWNKRVRGPSTSSG
jgi:hypothetical protein